MAVTSTMAALGSAASDFSLQDVVLGKTKSLSDFSDKGALLVMFFCNHCPYAIHVQGEIAILARDHKDKDIGIVAISSNDVAMYPDDSPVNLKAQSEAQGFTFPYLYDETQEVAKAYTAACTPDFFLFDKSRKLVYRGQLDDSRPGNNVPVTGKDLRAAIDALLLGNPINESQRPSSGCNIKWKPGNEPDYFR